MLADDIPQLLQSLLVGVERALYRISLDDLSFPLAKVNNNLQNSGNDKLSNATTASESLSENNNKTRSSVSSSGLLKLQQQNNQPSASTCSSSSTSNNLLNASDLNVTTAAVAVAASSPIKRSIECTLKRSKIISGGNKHSLKRYTNNNKCGDNFTTNNSINNNSLNEFYDGGVTGGGSDMTSNAPASCEINSMPLFCLGGEFPHIDSDEESSSEDIKRTSDAGK